MPSDSYYGYDDFEAFSLPASRLNHPYELHLPRELVSHDVNESEWLVIPLTISLVLPVKHRQTDHYNHGYS